MKPKAPTDTVQIDKINASDKIDAKSRLGYFSEFVVAYELASLIDNEGGKLTERSKLGKLKSNMLLRKAELINLKINAEELKRQETGGKVIAKQMFEDLILNGKEGNDYHTLEFDIQLTGDSAKGVDKADVVITVKRPSKNTIIDKIAASLKTYKQPNINLSNKTFTGLLKDLTGDPEYENKSLQKFENIIFTSMVQEFMKIKKIKDFKLAESIVGSGEAFLKKYGVTLFNKLKEAGRAASKTSHKQVSKLIVSEFNKVYEKNKKKMNENLLHLIGLDGSDDFYAAIGTAGKQKVLSSRQSKEMKEFLDSVKTNKLNIKMQPSSSGNAIEVNIILEKEVIAKSTISFTDTGIGSKGMTKSKGAGKTNFWFNVKAFL
jgi:hypothetical protein